MPYGSPTELKKYCIVIILTSSSTEQEIQTKHIKIWGVRVYIINRGVTRNKLDDISHHGYCMGYAATSGIVIYWKTDQPFFIYKSHYIPVDEYDHHPFIKDNHTPGCLPLQQDPETHIYNSYVLNFNPCELDITYTPFCDTIILTYEI